MTPVADDEVSLDDPVRRHDPASDDLEIAHALARFPRQKCLLQVPQRAKSGLALPGSLPYRGRPRGALSHTTARASRY